MKVTGLVMADLIGTNFLQWDWLTRFILLIDRFTWHSQQTALSRMKMFQITLGGGFLSVTLSFIMHFEEFRYRANITSNCMLEVSMEIKPCICWWNVFRNNMFYVLLCEKSIFEKQLMSLLINLSRVFCFYLLNSWDNLVGGFD